MTDNLLTVADVSKLAHISPTAVRDWGKELESVLTKTANPPKGQIRRFTQSDVLIFNTARIMRAENCGWPEIIAKVRDGNLYELEEMPVKVVHHKPKQPRGRVVNPDMYEQLVAPYRAQVALLTDERDYLRQRVSDLEEKLIAVESIMTRLAQLEAHIQAKN